MAPAGQPTGKQWHLQGNLQVNNFLNMLQTVFSLQNPVYFIMLPFFGACIIRILHTGCAEI
jgi:hypothetical protein